MVTFLFLVTTSSLPYTFIPRQGSRPDFDKDQFVKFREETPL